MTEPETESVDADDFRGQFYTSERALLVEPYLAGELRQALKHALSTLSKTEADVIARRFGLGSYNEHTLQQVGDAHGGLSKERIRQIEAKALRRLRHPTRRNGLVDRRTRVMALSPLRQPEPPCYSGFVIQYWKALHDPYPGDWIYERDGRLFEVMADGSRCQRTRDEAPRDVIDCVRQVEGWRPAGTPPR